MRSGTAEPARYPALRPAGHSFMKALRGSPRKVRCFVVPLHWRMRSCCACWAGLGSRRVPAASRPRRRAGR
jgi:hypothetical protein